MPVVRMPNGDKIRFPDDMPREQIRDVIAAKFPEETAHLTKGRGGWTDPVKQGFAFGFSDEIEGAIGGVGRTFQGGEFGEGYSEARDSARENLEGYRDDHPIASTALEIAGAIPTALIGGGFGLAGKGLAAALKGGAIAGTAYGAGTAEGGLPERALGAGIGAAIGTAGGAVTFGAGRLVQQMIQKGIARRAVQAVSGSKEIRKAGDDLIKQAKKGHGKIPAEDFKSAVSRMNRQAVDDIAIPENQPKSIAMLQKLQEFLEGDVPLERLYAMRRAILNAKRGADGNMARRMVGEIDDVIARAVHPDAKKLQQGISTNARGKRARIIEKAISRADNAKAGFQRGMQAELGELLDSEKKLRGFSKTEKYLIKKMHDGGFIAELARRADNAGNTVATGVAGVIGDWWGLLAAPVILGLIRKLNNEGARQAADLLRATIANGKALKLPPPKPVNMGIAPMVAGGQSGRATNLLTNEWRPKVERHEAP